MNTMVVKGRLVNLDTCPDCKGSGHTEETKPELSLHKTKPRVRTVRLGSGCPRCRGTGVIA